MTLARETIPMNFSGTCEMRFPGDRKPRSDPWWLFKVGSAERIKQMQGGLLYMNSLEYFSGLDGEAQSGLRADASEGVFARPETKSWGGIHSEIELAYGTEDERKSILLNQEASVTLNMPDPANTILFCMGALADGENGLIDGEENGEVILSRRFEEFGEATLLINSPQEFSERISAAIAKDNHLFSSLFMEGCCGLVDYIEPNTFFGNLGVFRKDDSYRWQREFRIILGAKDAAMNASGAYELNVGDISDISTIINTKSFIKAPIKLKRRKYRKLGDDYEIMEG